jgi:hypothetical protein
MSKIEEIKINLSDFRLATLEKITDDKFNGAHPNGVNVGRKSYGIVVQEPIVGQSCVVGDLITSIVIEVVDKNSFKTLNSTYKIVYDKLSE